MNTPSTGHDEAGESVKRALNAPSVCAITHHHAPSRVALVSIGVLLTTATEACFVVSTMQNLNWS